MTKTDANGLPQRLTIEIRELLDRKEVGIPRDRRALDEEEREIDAILAFARSGRSSVAQSRGGENWGIPGAQGFAAAKADVKTPKITHRVLVVLSLEQRPKGGSVGYIVAWAAAVNVMDGDVARTSISPLLKKMSDTEKGKDEVRHDRDAHRWIITEDGMAVAAAFRDKWLAAGKSPFWNVVVEDPKDSE
jgi:hypothetical protein